MSDQDDTEGGFFRNAIQRERIEDVGPFMVGEGANRRRQEAITAHGRQIGRSDASATYAEYRARGEMLMGNRAPVNMVGRTNPELRTAVEMRLPSDGFGGSNTSMHPSTLEALRRMLAEMTNTMGIPRLILNQGVNHEDMTNGLNLSYDRAEFIRRSMTLIQTAEDRFHFAIPLPYYSIRVNESLVLTLHSQDFTPRISNDYQMAIWNIACSIDPKEGLCAEDAEWFPHYTIHNPERGFASIRMMDTINLHTRADQGTPAPHADNIFADDLTDAMNELPPAPEEVVSVGTMTERRSNDHSSNQVNVAIRTAMDHFNRWCRMRPMIVDEEIQRELRITQEEVDRAITFTASCFETFLRSGDVDHSFVGISEISYQLLKRYYEVNSVALIELLGQRLASRLALFIGLGYRQDNRNGLPTDVAAREDNPPTPVENPDYISSDDENDW